MLKGFSPLATLMGPDCANMTLGLSTSVHWMMRPLLLLTTETKKKNPDGNGWEKTIDPALTVTTVSNGANGLHLD